MDIRRTCRDRHRRRLRTRRRHGAHAGRSRRQGGDLRREPEGRRRGGGRYRRHRGALRRHRWRRNRCRFRQGAPPTMARRASSSIAPASGRPSASSAATGRCRLPISSASSSINLIGTFNVLRLAAAAMIGLDPLLDGERGIIVCTASVAAYEGQIGQAAYAASKGGVVGLVMPAAREFAQFGIRVNAIAPGIFSTPMLRPCPSRRSRALRRRCRSQNCSASRRNTPRWCAT